MDLGGSWFGSWGSFWSSFWSSFGSSFWSSFGSSFWSSSWFLGSNLSWLFFGLGLMGGFWNGLVYTIRSQVFSLVELRLGKVRLIFIFIATIAITRVTKVMRVSLKVSCSHGSTDKCNHERV